MKRAQDLVNYDFGPIISTPKRQKHFVEPKEIAERALCLLEQLDDESTVPYPLLHEIFEKSQNLLFSKGHGITKFVPNELWDQIISYALPDDLTRGLRILGSLALVCTGWRVVTAQIFARIGFHAKSDSDYNLLRFPELTSLSLPATSKITMRSLSTLGQLASLDLGANFQATFDLSKLPQLRDLYIGDNASIKLGYLPNLRRLHFDDKADVGVSTLSRLIQLVPNLAEFRPGNNFSSADLLHLTMLTALTRLELGRPKRANSNPIFPAIHLPNLKYLSVNNTCPEDAIEIQTSVTHLDHASYGTPATPGVHRYTSALTNLTHLSTDLSVNYPNETYLHELPVLTSLNLRDYYRSLWTLTKLKRLTLRAFNEIGSLTQLTHLSFDHYGILSTLERLPMLRHLRVHHVDSLGIVSNLTHLESLVLTGCRDIRDQLIQPLVSLRCLRLEPALGHHGLTPKGLSHLNKLVEFQLIPVNQEITRYFRKHRRSVKLYDYPYLGMEYDF